MSIRYLGKDDPVAGAVVATIQSGDLANLERLLREHSGLATARLGTADKSRSLLHAATDWPGHFPNGVAIVKALIAAGADVNARCVGSHHTETPLHWTASSDDVAVLDALLDAGADIGSIGGVIGNGTPLADAVAFGQWKAARRLLERGARANLWQAAAMGLLARVEEHFAGESRPTPEDVTNAFWCACHGGRRETAEYLLARGADLNWVGYDGKTPLDAANNNGFVEVAEWLAGIGARSGGGKP
jgi:ankyrin repeat protein